MVVGAPVTYDDEDDVDVQFVCEGGKSAEMNPLLNGHETVEERGDFEWKLTAVPSNSQKIKVRMLWWCHISHFNQCVIGSEKI